MPAAMKAILTLLSLTTLAFGALALAVQTGAPQRNAPTAKPGISANPEEYPGRYQIIMRPNVRADTFLLDTQTGRIWIPVEYSNVKGQPTIWKYEERVDNQAGYEQWEMRQEPIPQTTSGK
jgi:hypothetical protein